MRFSYASLLQKTSFKSHVHTDYFGAYHSRHISIQLNQRRKQALAPWDIDKFIEETDDLDICVSKALESFAYFHELRHFHDFFGTMGGICLFTDLIVMLKEFADVVMRLRSEGQKWELPLPDWARRNDCPDYVRLFVNRCQVSEVAQQIFQGSINLSIEEGLTEEVWRDVEVPELNLTFPAFPFSIGLQDPTDPNRIRDLSVWRPLGLEALLEGVSQSLQRTYLEIFWPQSVSDAAWEKMTRPSITVRRDYGNLEEVLQQSMLPYNTTDLLISKLLRQHGINDPWERQLLLLATDRSLMMSLLSCKATDIPAPIPGRKATKVEVTSRHPGANFIDTIQQADWSKPDAIKRFSLPPNVLLDIRAPYADIKRPHDFLRSSQFDAIEVIEAFVRHEIIVPIIDLRIKYGSSIFDDAGQYFSKLKEFPKPLITVFADDFETSDSVDDTILGKWVEFCMLVNILEQLLSGSTVITCPRAYALVPGFSFFNMTNPGDCENHIRDRSCLVWSDGRLELLPNCSFKNLIRLLGLESRH